MAVDANKVIVGTPDQQTTGAIKSAPLGTTLPDTIDAKLDQAFIDGDSGYVSSDGVSLTQDISTSDITEWGGALVRRLLDSFAGSIAWSYIQTGEAELKNAFGADSVTVTAAANAQHGTQIKVSIGARLPERKSWIFAMKDGDARLMVVVPIGQITSRDDITFNRTDPVSWPLTLTCYPDSEGNSLYLLFDDGRKVAVQNTTPGTGA
ncbi:hypothetical protein [Bifidobacterium simiiventris]|uniref:phage tail tube protein n=1 Tax=Bifidobacterium simiiventris TaxID=2834434 RepID=UPI001C58E37F|nr:hypothetical protein [Bifidobacterium simiiventris]MBW3077689.1 hypothetical protein [Bifidobacterium simiiventris]